jgi:cell division protein FtsL
MKSNQKSGFKTVHLIILIAVCLVSVVFIRQQITINSNNNEIKTINEQIEAENKKAKEIKEKEKQYATDEYVEQIARDELGLVKPDEKVFVDSGNN